jgi:hypothetical protein
MVKHNTCKGLGYTWEEIKDIKPEPSEACFLGKFLKFPAPASHSTKTTRPIQILHADVGGPIKQVSKHNNKYWLLIYDQYTTYQWINFYSNKQSDQIIDDIINIQLTIDKLGKIEIIRTDSDVIFKSDRLRKWAKKNGSQLQSTAPYRHEGHIEKAMYTLLQLTRTNLIAADLDDSYWDSTMESVIYAINRTPNSRSHGKTPYELLNGDVSNLIPIGYPTIVKVYDEETDYYEDYDKNNEVEYHKRKRRTLDPRGRRGIVIDYSNESPNSYLVECPGKRDSTRKDIIVPQNAEPIKDKMEFKKPLIFEDEDEEIATIPLYHDVQYPSDIPENKEQTDHRDAVIPIPEYIAEELSRDDDLEKDNIESDEELIEEKEEENPPEGVYRGTRRGGQYKPGSYTNFTQMRDKVYGLNENVKEKFIKKAEQYNKEKNLNLPITEDNVAKLLSLSYNESLLAREIQSLKNDEDETIDHKLCSRINKEQLDRFIHSLYSECMDLSCMNLSPLICLVLHVFYHIL